MRHSVYGRNFSRTSDERKRLFAGLVRSLLIHDVIVTSLAKTKAIQPMVEKLVTRAKSGKDTDYRRIFRIIPDRDIVKRLMDDAKTRFSGRNSGYTRIIKLGMRDGDATEMAQLSFVDVRVMTSVIAPKPSFASNFAKASLDKKASASAKATADRPADKKEKKAEKPKKEIAKKTVKKTVKKS